MAESNSTTTKTVKTETGLSKKIKTGTTEKSSGSQVEPTTGGGVPLAKGEKLKDHPVPRDEHQAREDDGTFGTKAETGETRKYPYHGRYGGHNKDGSVKEIKKPEDRQTPGNLKGKGKGESLFQKKEGIKTGDVIVSSDGSRWISTSNISQEDVQKYITTCYNDVKTGKKKIFLFENGTFIKKMGRKSGAEKAAIKQKNYLSVVAHQNIEAMSEERIKDIQASAFEFEKRGAALKDGLFEQFGGKANYAKIDFTGGTQPIKEKKDVSSSQIGGQQAPQNEPAKNPQVGNDGYFAPDYVKNNKQEFIQKNSKLLDNVINSVHQKHPEISIDKETLADMIAENKIKLKG